MSYIIIPSKWTRQPTGVVRPHSAVRELIDAPRMYGRVGAFGSALTVGSNASVTVDGVSSPGVSGYGALFGPTTNDLQPRTGPFIYVFRFKNNATAGTQSIVTSSSSGTAAGSNHWYVFSSWSGSVYEPRLGGDASLAPGVRKFVTGEWVTIALWRVGAVITMSAYGENNGLWSYSTGDIGDVYNRNAVPFGFMGSATSGTANGVISLFAYAPSVFTNPFDIVRNPYGTLYVPDVRRIYFGAGGGTTTTITESVSARLKARGSETSAPTRTESAVARRKARGAATVTAIKVEAVVGRRKARGAATTAIALRTEASAGRVKARGTTTVTHIDAGAVVESVAGRRQVRASVTAAPIRTEAVVARRQARGSDTVTLTRTIAAVGRSKARGAVTAAPLVAGMITEAVAGRLRARGSSTVTTTRIEAVAACRRARGSAVINGIRSALAAGRARLRAAVAGAPYVPPTLPLEVPESTRTLNAQESRIGSSPVAADPRRLGAATTRKAPPRRHDAQGAAAVGLTIYDFAYSPPAAVGIVPICATASLPAIRSTL